MKTRIEYNHIKIGLLCTTSLILFITSCCASQALEFTIEPSDRTAPEGSSVLLQCAGHMNSKKLAKIKDGKISPNIRWRGPDDSDIGIDTFRSQMSNGSLYINNVNENHGLTGNYQCLLSVDGIGTIVSRKARLSIAAKPELNQEAQEISLFVGQTAYFKCMSSQNIYDNKNYRIQWMKNNQQLRIDDTRMLILPSGALEIDELTTQDRGTYQCNVSYESFHRVSSKTNLNIRSPSGNPENFAPPSFVIIPSTQTVREKDNVILDCATNGNPKPKITWLRDGIDIDFNDLDSRFRLIGTGSLQISSVQDGDSGDYQCRASNSVDSLDATATIHVQLPPKFVVAPYDLKASEKDELELPCEIIGKPKPTVQWLKNGEVIKPNDYMKFTNGNNLKILGLIESDSGMFQCVGINDAGSVQMSAYVQVTPQESANKHQMSHSNNKKKTTKKFLLSTVATTKKPTKPDLKMMKSSYPNDSSSDRSKQISKQALDSLQSKNKNSPDLASGRIADTNDYLDRLNDNQAQSESDYNDYDEDEEDDDGEGSIHPLNSDTDPNQLLHELTKSKNNHKTSLTHHEISHFSNSNQNPVTRKTNHPAEDNANHPPVPLPGPPKAVQAVIVKPRFITINWLEPEENPDEVVSYTVYYSTLGNDARERKISTNSRDEQEVNIQSLLPGTTYRIRVVGNSNHAQGRSSEMLEIATQSEEGVVGTPENFQATTLSEQAIYLRWEPPKVTNGPITKYRILYTEGENGAELTAETSSTEHTLDLLRSYCEYTVSVAAVNQNGMGNPTEEKLVKTYSAAPSEPPLNVSLEASSSTTIIVRWELPPEESRNGPITGYKLKYRKVKKSGAPQTETTPGNIRFYELKNLERMSSYQIRIAAMTINGTGPYSEWTFIDTYENDLDESHVPGEPGWIKTKAFADSIIVSWGPPAQQDIKVRGFILGWGNGIPDEFSHELDENARSYEISGLTPNNEYVLSLRARNMVGDGPPKYDSARTRDEISTETSQPLEVPVGLRAIPMSGSSIVVYWTDTTLGKTQHVKDSRYYTVRYSTTGSTRYRYFNTTDLSCMITELKPQTMYEFEVKVVKGRRESLWSMSVLNSTMSAAPASPPRDLTVKMLDDKTPLSVLLNWLPPKHSNSPITNYVILYSTDSEKRDKEWLSENVPADKTSVIINQLNPHTTYYFKVQSKHGKSLGPFSAMVSLTTGLVSVDTLNSVINGANINISSQMLLSLVGALFIASLIIVTTVLMICCRKKPQETPEHKKSYQKNPANVLKPPDLWIHHDHVEMKNIEKLNGLHQTSTPGCSDGASSSGVMTLPRSVVGHDFENETQFPTQITNSLDKRTYVPGYMTNSMSSSASDRVQYARAPYNMQRGHIAMPSDPSSSQQNITNGSIIHSPENPYAYDVVSSNYSSNPSMIIPPPPLSLDMANHRGHPLRSFSIPAPPTAQNGYTGHMPGMPVTVIRASQNSSPFKKSTITTPTNRLTQPGPFVTYSTDEVMMLRPSTSTEELNQEMANLEGLMKDLSAITASEFEC